jgi:hypothetical protein
MMQVVWFICLLSHASVTNQVHKIQAGKYGAKNEVVSGNACACIVCLARSDANRLKIIELNGIYIVMLAIKLFGKDNEQVCSKDTFFFYIGA